MIECKCKDYIGVSLQTMVGKMYTGYQYIGDEGGGGGGFKQTME